MVSNLDYEDYRRQRVKLVQEKLEKNRIPLLTKTDIREIADALHTMNSHRLNHYRFLNPQNNTLEDIKNSFKELLHGIPKHVHELDSSIEPLLDRPFHELDSVECAVMRLGVYELKYRIDVPYKVVINEAIELAKTFGAEESHKYVNSILDQLAKNFRELEVNAARSSSKRTVS